MCNTCSQAEPLVSRKLRNLKIQKLREMRKWTTKSWNSKWKQGSKQKNNTEDWSFFSHGSPEAPQAWLALGTKAQANRVENCHEISENVQLGNSSYSKYRRKTEMSQIAKDINPLKSIWTKKNLGTRTTNVVVVASWAVLAPHQAVPSSVTSVQVAKKLHRPCLGWNHLARLLHKETKQLLSIRNSLEEVCNTVSPVLAVLAILSIAKIALPQAICLPTKHFSIQ